MNSSNPDKNAT